MFFRETLKRATAPSIQWTQPPEKQARVDEEAPAGFVFATLDSESDVLTCEIELDEVAFAAFTEDPKKMVRKALKKGQAEINLRKATPEVKAKVGEAKMTEVNNWLQNEVCIAAKRVYGDKPMKMRWHLILKEGVKAKARLIILGFQDPRLGKLNKAAPTVSTRGRNLALQLMANNGLRMYKGDVKAAFLHGSDISMKYDLLVEPVKELREAMQLKDDEVVKLLKAAYGLMDAPKEWHLKVDTDLTQQLQYVDMQYEPCVWIKYSQDHEIEAVIFVHVDDFVIGVKENSRGMLHLADVKGLYQWGEWESGHITQCGSEYIQLGDYTIIQSLEKACQKVQQIELSAYERRLRADQPLPDSLKSKCRAALGSTMFLASQGMAWLAGETSILGGEVPTGTMETVKKVNKLVRMAHETATVVIIFRPIKDPVFVTWHDAAWAARKSGSSQGGMVIGMAERRILHNEKSPVSVIQGSSRKLPRVARSSLSAEVQMGTIANEEQEYVRLAWHEMCTGQRPSHHNIQDALRATTGTLVTDCKAMYDSVMRACSAGLGCGGDKRSAIEALAMKQSMTAAQTLLRWVHSEAMAADGLTKTSAPAVQTTMQFYTRREWSLVHDPTFTSAKKRKARGHDILETIEYNPVEAIPMYEDDDPETDYEIEAEYARFAGVSSSRRGR